MTSRQTMVPLRKSHWVHVGLERSLMTSLMIIRHKLVMETRLLPFKNLMSSCVAQLLSRTLNTKSLYSPTFSISSALEVTHKLCCARSRSKLEIFGYLCTSTIGENYSRSQTVAKFTSTCKETDLLGKLGALAQFYLFFQGSRVTVRLLTS